MFIRLELRYMAIALNTIKALASNRDVFFAFVAIYWFERASCHISHDDIEERFLTDSSRLIWQFNTLLLHT